MEPGVEAVREMSITVCCKELGMKCGFLANGEEGRCVLEDLMRHVYKEHPVGWFEKEEIYQVACTVIREKAA